MKHLNLSTFVLFLIIIYSVRAQNSVAPGARSTALGSASVTFSDPFSAVNNPAGMSFLKQSSFAFSFDDRFLLMELSLKTIVATINTRHGNFGFSLLRQGNQAYNTTSAGVSYARKLGTQFSVGMRCRLERIMISEGYGERLNPGCDIGMLMNLRENLVFGVNIYNPARPILSKAFRERMPSVFRTGLCYLFSPKLRMLAEVSKHSSQAMQFHTGTEYEVSQKFIARAGFSAFPFRYSFGFSFSFKTLRIEIASTYHEKLGFSPSTSISYNF